MILKRLTKIEFLFHYTWLLDCVFLDCNAVQTGPHKMPAFFDLCWFLFFEIFEWFFKFGSWGFVVACFSFRISFLACGFILSYNYQLYF